MLSLLELSSWIACRKQCNTTFRKNCTMMASGKDSKSFSQMPLFQARENTKFLISSDHRDHNLDTILTLVTAYMVRMQI